MQLLFCILHWAWQEDPELYSLDTVILFLCWASWLLSLMPKLQGLDHRAAEQSVRVLDRCMREAKDPEQHLHICLPKWKSHWGVETCIVACIGPYDLQLIQSEVVKQICSSCPLFSKLCLCLILTWVGVRVRLLSKAPWICCAAW